LQPNSFTMISFYPGPSRVHDDIPKYVKDAHRKGLLSMNHRSHEFMALCEKTISLLKEKLDIPSSYSVFFTSSATECWEIIAQSLIKKESLHIFNGAFGEKWFEYTNRLIPGAKKFIFGHEQMPTLTKISARKSELICFTQNETSNGTQIRDKLIASVHKKNPKALIAVDATSSMAGINLNFKAADVWFASIQKCFGLPAGLAVMICSPKAIDRAKSIIEQQHYNSLGLMNEMMEKWQTPYTPNVMAIYLLMRVLKKSKKINLVNKKTTGRAKAWNDFFKEGQQLRPYIQNAAVRSSTVITITGKPELLVRVKSEAKENGFLLGEGYGKLKGETFRIANFPAIKKREIKQLKSFLNDWI